MNGTAGAYLLNGAVVPPQFLTPASQADLAGTAAAIPAAPQTGGALPLIIGGVLVLGALLLLARVS